MSHCMCTYDILCFRLLICMDSPGHVHTFLHYSSLRRRTRWPSKPSWKWARKSRNAAWRKPKRKWSGRGSSRRRRRKRREERPRINTDPTRPPGLNPPAENHCDIVTNLLWHHFSGYVHFPICLGQLQIIVRQETSSNLFKTSLVMLTQLLPRFFQKANGKMYVFLRFYWNNNIARKIVNLPTLNYKLHGKTLPLLAFYSFDLIVLNMTKVLKNDVTSP